MKKFIPWMLLICVLAMGATKVYNYAQATLTSHVTTLRSAVAANDTAPAETTGKYANAPAHAYTRQETDNYLEIWFAGNADTDSAVASVYACRRGGDVRKVWTGTLTVGARDSTSSENYVDTFATTTDTWITTVSEVDAGGNDRIASLVFDTCGYEKIWVYFDGSSDISGSEAYTVFISGF